MATNFKWATAVFRFIQHGERYDDYREQLVDDDTLNRELAQYGEVTGVETDSSSLSD